MNLFKLFFNKNSKPIRRYLKDVIPGESIRIEWKRIKNGVGYVTCVNNYPKDKKLFIEVRWTNYKELGIDEYYYEILPYNDNKLLNFTLLNPVENNTEPESINEDEFILSVFSKRMEEAINSEKYEIANEIQKNIDLFKNLKKFY